MAGFKDASQFSGLSNWVDDGCHFLRWGTEDGGRWRRRLVHFCTCDAEAALGHPGGVVEKAGDV